MDRVPGKGKAPHDWSKDLLPCKLLQFSDFTELEVELEVPGDVWVEFRTRGSFGCAAGEERK